MSAGRSSALPLENNGLFALTSPTFNQKPESLPKWMIAVA
jgi:hypothetical protein